ncbi:tetratricopeptide repeat protein 9C-like [Haemaphysalis longicornis]
MADVAAAADPVSEPRPSDSLQAPPIGGRDSLLQNITVAKLRKEEGNELYKNKKIKAAILKYHAALLCIKACNLKEEPGADVKDQLAQLRANCYNNLAACLLLQPSCDLHRVLEYTTNVLRVLPRNTKALFRKGVAHYRLKNYILARQYLEDAKQLRKAPDQEIEKYIQLCQEATQDKPAAAAEE